MKKGIFTGVAILLMLAAGAQVVLKTIVTQGPVIAGEPVMRFFASETDVPRGCCHRPDGTISVIGLCSASAYSATESVLSQKSGGVMPWPMRSSSSPTAPASPMSPSRRGRDVRRCVRGPPPVAMGDEAPSVARIGRKSSEFPRMPVSRASYAASLFAGVFG